MKFRTSPPDPAEFPRVRLLWPIATPAALAAVLVVGELTGHEWNVHGMGALLLFAFLLSVAVGLFASIVSLATAVPALRKYPTLRTKLNIACVAASALFALVAAGYLTVGIGAVLLA